MKLKIIPSIIAAGALLVPGLLLAQDSQPSLADVAKQKANTAKAKKVITDEDIPSTSTPPVPAAASEASGSGASSSATTPTEDTKSPTDATAKSESGSKTGGQTSKLAALQKELDDVNHDDALLRKKLAQLQTKIDNATDPFRKRMYEESIETQQVTLSQFLKKRQELEHQIADEKSKSKS